MIYIANCTKQTLRYAYRLPEVSRDTPFYLDIPSGRQEALGEKWSAAQRDAVIQHMESFGFRDVSSVNVKMSEFDGILYSTVKPISEDNIDIAHEALVEKQEMRSADEAVKAAVSMDVKGRDPRNRKKRLASVSEVEVIQDLPAREKPSGKEINFKVTVDEGGTENFKYPGQK